MADAWREGGTTVKTGLATAAVTAVAATSAGAADHCDHIHAGLDD